MSESLEKLDIKLRLAEKSARSGAHQEALDILDETENALETMPERMSNAGGELGLKILNNRGIVLKNLERFEESEKCFRKASELIESGGEINPKLPVGVYLNLANLLSRKGDYNAALESFMRALNATGRLEPGTAGDIRSKIHNNMALFYCNHGEQDKAQEELDKCLKYKGSDDFRIDFEKERQAWIRNNLGLIHSELAEEKDLTDDSASTILRRSALGFFREALEIYRSIDYGIMVARTLLNISAVERRLGMKQDAALHLEEAVTKSMDLNSTKLLARAYEQCVNFYLQYQEPRFVGAIDDLLRLLAREKVPSGDNIIRRVEDRARRSGNATVVDKIRASLGNNSGRKEVENGVDGQVAPGGR